MWTQTNENLLDRGGCGDELFIDASFKTLACLAGLAGDDLMDDVDMLDDADDFAGH